MADDKTEHWSVDRRIPIGLIMTIVVQTVKIQQPSVFTLRSSANLMVELKV